MRSFNWLSWFFIAACVCLPMFGLAESRLITVGNARAGVGEAILLDIKISGEFSDPLLLELRGLPDSISEPVGVKSSNGETITAAAADANRLAITVTGLKSGSSGLILEFSPAKSPVLLSAIDGVAKSGSDAIPVVSGSVAVALLTNPITIFSFFAAIVYIIFWLSTLVPLKPIFRYLPAVIWMYFLPMLGTTLGITPDSSPLYSPFMSRVLLPATLVLLLISSDLRGVMKIGPTALLMMLWATTSIVIGGIGSFAIIHILAPELLPEDAWKGVAALAGSWIGGSANMTAVIGSLEVAPTIIGPLIIMDTVLVYSWLAVLVTLSNYHHEIDKKHNARTEVVQTISKRMEKIQVENERPIRVADAAMMIGLAFAISHVCMLLGPVVFGWLAALFSDGWAGTIREIANPFTVSILLITVVGVLLSLTRLRQLEHCGASSLGYVGFYFVLCGYGAQANLQAVTELPGFFALGILWLGIHVVFLYIGMRVLRAPLFLAATSSMANMGGPSSAPLVAAAYYQAMAPLGLLKAVLGGVLGTPIALFVVAYVCRLISRW